MNGVARYVIGDPGRAAVEVTAGPLPARIGVADVELSAAQLGGMQVRAASSRGLEHRAAGMHRQDAFAMSSRTTPAGPDQLVVVVCDGVGSLARSDEAAATASRRLAELGASGIPWSAAFCDVNAELTEAIGARSPGDGLMATTALAAVVGRACGDWVLDAAWIGDCALWHLNPQSHWTPVTPEPPDLEPGIHSGTVASLPAPDGTPAVCSARLHGGALFLMSDGIANPLRWSADVRSTLARWWAVPPDPYTFAAQADFGRTTHVDDRTVVGIWPDGGVHHGDEV
ncbi:MAG TPA: protein phosphatase 2C domain-containing protein [Streptosporangiaceae bacterium]|nr:protein phosphatase 2C domain-containing protein [Streptosporangiaceae bacterium]